MTTKQMRCEKHGYDAVLIWTRDDGTQIWSPCPTCKVEYSQHLKSESEEQGRRAAEAMRAEAEEREKREIDDRRSRLKRESCVPAKFANTTLGDWVPETKPQQLVRDQLGRLMEGR